KLYKRSTLFMAIVVIIDIVSIIALIVFKDRWINNKVITIVLFVLFVFLLTTIYSYYDLNADKNIIRKAVENGDVALAKINNGTFVRFARDARLKNHVYWKLDVEIFDNDMKKHDATIIEKFSTHQTQIPKGYVYVTYVEGKKDDSLIIPNIIIASIPEYKVLVDDYEKAIKPKYLNAYINDGLILQTYEESLKAQKEAENK
ncbi:MAG: hypothetical protein IKD94_05395, partial [Erysipelotrichaceae bacterium]|nr:hypothetical protein [Erysipelotrichaceae bacterium]